MSRYEPAVHRSELQVEHGITKPSRRLQSPFGLDPDTWVAEVRKARGKKRPLSSAALRALRDEHAATIASAQRRRAETRQLERRLADLVHAAYGLTAEEVELMWRTAPPRMPLAGGGEPEPGRG